MHTTRRTILAAALTALALLLTGCQSLLRDGSTVVRIDKDDLHVEYRSPKDQDITYDPATGEIRVTSRSNEALAQSAATAHAESTKALAQAIGQVIERVPVAP